MERQIIKAKTIKRGLRTKLFTFNNISLSGFLKSSFIFVSFALFNGLLPLFICLILSCIKVMGAQYTMAIGYITAIQLGFVQLSWSISIAIFYAFYKEKNKVVMSSMSDFFVNYVLVTLLYTAIATIIFFISSFIYNLYASKHINTLFGQKQAFYYIFIVWVYIFFNSFIYGFFIFIQINKSWWAANLFMLGYMALIIGLVALFTLLMNNDPQTSILGFWCGFGLSLGSIIYFAILCIYIRFGLKISFKFRRENRANIKLLLSKSYRQLLLITTIQIFKAIALIALGLTIADTINGIVPIFYQMSRVIWYNLLYLLPFLGYGMADAILCYGFLHQPEEIDAKELNKLTIMLFIGVFIFEILLSIGIYYAIGPLAITYLKNKDWAESMKQYDTSSIDLVPLIESLLKKENIQDTLKSLNSNKDIADYLLSKGIDIKKLSFITQNILNQQVFPIFLKYKTLLTSDDPAVRTQAINNILDAIKGIKFLGKPIDPDLKLTKAAVAVILENAKSDTIYKMFDIRTCNTYYYMVAWTTLYSCGLIFNSSKMILRRNVYTWWQTTLIAFVQAIIIGAVVAIGVTQQYSTALPMYDAWTMPLCLAGSIIFGYYLITYIVRYKKVMKVYLNSHGHEEAIKQEPQKLEEPKLKIEEVKIPEQKVHEKVLLVQEVQNEVKQPNKKPTSSSKPKQSTKSSSSTKSKPTSSSKYNKSKIK